MTNSHLDVQCFPFTFTSQKELKKHFHFTFDLFQISTLMRAAPTSSDDVVFDDFEIELEVNETEAEFSFV